MTREPLEKTDAPALPARANQYCAGLDPRRARMVREVAGFGLDLRVGAEIGRLLLAMGLGSALTFALVGPKASTARVESRPTFQVPMAVTPAADIAAAPAARDEPDSLAYPAPSLPDTPQRDVHSDGGGH